MSVPPEVEAVRRIMAVEEGCPYDTACFHGQQAIEKYLKALLTLSGVPAPRTHDLENLLTLLPPDRQPSLSVASLVSINPCAVAIRYSDYWREPTRSDAICAFDIAQPRREQAGSSANQP